MKPLRHALSLLCLLGALSGAAVSQAAPLAEKTLLSDSDERSYLLFVPPGAAPDKPAPLVIMLHGGGGNGENAAWMSGFTETAWRENFAVAFPNGSGRREDKLLTWNAGHCCGYAMKNEVNDVQFIADLIDQLVADQNIDPDRVFVTGMSNGAMMSHRLGIELPHKIAAIAPVVGTLFGDETLPPAPVPALIINGALDESVPPAGGPPGGIGARAWDGTPAMPAAYQGEFWAKANGCRSTPRHTTSPDGLVQRWNYLCPNGGAVTRYLVMDNGHAWPGGEKGSRRGNAPSQALDATAVIWDFFRRLDE